MSVLDQIKKENASNRNEQRKIAFNYLFDNAVENDDLEAGKFYLFEYKPKYLKQLRHWDRYPLVLVLEKYTDGFLGANFHYTTQKNRILLATLYLNKNIRLKDYLLHRYIPEKADNIFFQVEDKDLTDFAALNIEQFYDSNSRFMSSTKIQKV
jgi:hypothetical protein